MASVATVDLLSAAEWPDFLDGTQACFPAIADGFYDQAKGARGEAKRVCRGCPLRDPCLAWALRTRQVFGVWGATAPADRQKLWKAGVS